MQAHFGTDPIQRLGEEMRIAHPGLHGAEGVLDGFPSNPHAFGSKIQALLHGLEHVFVFPAGHFSRLIGCALGLECALLAR